MENRRHPRVNLYSSQILSPLSDASRPLAVVSKNVSASGTCIRSKNSLAPGTPVLLKVNDALLEDLKENRGRVVKVGGCILAHVVWNKKAAPEDPYHELGLRFVPVEEGNEETLSQFVGLVNRQAVQRL